METNVLEAESGRQMGRGKRLLTIFTVLFKVGCVTFGGGWGIIAQMQEEFVDRRHWMEEEQLVDFISLGKSFPGIMIINIAVLFGYTMEGFWGAVIAAFSLSLPALISITVVTYFYSALKDNGVRCAVIPIMLAAAVRLKGKSLVDKPGYVLAGIAVLVCTFTGVNKALVVIGGAAFGLLTLAAKKRGRKS